MSMAEFFAMNGYAHYVWPAYGTAFILLAALLLSSLRRRRRLKKDLGEVTQQP